MHLNLERPKPQRPRQKPLRLQTPPLHSHRHLITIAQIRITPITTIAFIDYRQIARALSEAKNNPVAIRIPVQFFFGVQTGQFGRFREREEEGVSGAGNAGTGGSEGGARVASEDLRMLRFY